MDETRNPVQNRRSKLVGGTFLLIVVLWIVDFGLATIARNTHEPDAEYVAQRAREALAEGFWEDRRFRMGCKTQVSFWVYHSATCFTGPHGGEPDSLTLLYAQPRRRLALLSRLMMGDVAYLEGEVPGSRTFASIYEDRTWEIYDLIKNSEQSGRVPDGGKWITLEQGNW